MRTLIVVILYFIVSVANAQSDIVIDVFRKLPADKVFDLTIGTRDSMLAGKTYYPADNDTMQITAYNYGSSELVKDYLYVSMGFETGQRASAMVEIRSFVRKAGDHLILVSTTGGVPTVAYSQHELSAFIYGKDKKLVAFNRKIFPLANESLFTKHGIPDSVRKIILNNSNLHFDLSNEQVQLGLHSWELSKQKTLRKWLKGDLVDFDWIGDKFVAGKMEFEFDTVE